MNDAERIVAPERRMDRLEAVASELRILLRRALNKYDTAVRHANEFAQLMDGNGYDDD
jgi:hypothetical protein